MAGKRGLVVGGGGARGAWAVGALKYLFLDKGEEFDIVVGTSTGSTIAPLAALGAGGFDALKNNYLHITWDEIFGKRMLCRSEAWNGAWALLTGKDSVYTTDKFYQTILEKQLTQEYWDKLQDPAQSAEAWVCAVNIHDGSKCYYCARNMGMTREGFAKAMLASSSIPILMPKTKLSYGGTTDWFVDGGVKEMVPLGHAVRRGATDIRVITMGVDPLVEAGEYPHLPDVLLRTFELEEEETTKNDLETCELITEELDWRERLRVHLQAAFPGPAVDAIFAQTSQEDEPLKSDSGEPYKSVMIRKLTPVEPIGPTHIFDEALMTQYFDKGYEYAKAGTPANPEVNWKSYPRP
jgi:predicted acylesterase/phospholipase RssA